jgi:hypothetical protein
MTGTKKETWHKLTNVDAEARTADCSACGERVPVFTQTRPSKRTGGTYTTYRCRKNRNAVRAEDHRKYVLTPEGRAAKERSRLKSRDQKLRRLFGVSLEEVDSWTHCPICLREFGPDLRRCVDHCHTSGRFRGVLCHGCNSALGLINNEDPESLRRAAVYLENHQILKGLQ